MLRVIDPVFFSKKKKKSYVSPGKQLHYFNPKQYNKFTYVSCRITEILQFVIDIICRSHQ